MAKALAQHAICYSGIVCTLSVTKTQQRFTQTAAEEKSNAEDTRAIEYSVSGTGASIDKASGEVSVSENGTLTVYS